MKFSLLKFGYVAILLSGCSLPPEEKKLSKARHDLQESINQTKNSQRYPEERWWRIYNDPELTMLIEKGLARSPTIDEATARIEKAKSLAEQAGASLFPSVNATGRLEKYRQSYNMGVPYAAVPKGFWDAATLTMNISYELDFWGKNKERLRVALSEVHASSLEAAQVKIILSTSIATTYATLAQLYLELETAKQSVFIRAQTMRLFKDRHQSGLENEGSLDLAKSNHASAEAEVAALQESICLTDNGLKVLVGDMPGKELLSKPPHIPRVWVFNARTIPANLIGRRPDLMAARLRLEAAAHRINVARSGFYPNINLGAFLGQQSLGLGSFFKSSSFTSSFGPAISLPIFQGGLLEGTYNEAHADYSISLAQYESAILHALNEVASAGASLKALTLRTTKIKEALAAGERSHALAKSRYAGGLATYLDVLNAEDKLIQNKRAEADIKARQFILDIALIKALGGGFKLPDKVNIGEGNHGRNS